MSGGFRVEMNLDLGELIARKDAALPEALAQGMEHLRAVSAPLVPIETGRLVGSAKVHVEDGQASLTYDGPYARYQHYETQLHHEHGQAEYLSQPVSTEADAIVRIVADRIRQEL